VGLHNRVGHVAAHLKAGASLPGSGEDGGHVGGIGVALRDEKGRPPLRMALQNRADALRRLQQPFVGRGAAHHQDL